MYNEFIFCVHVFFSLVPLLLARWKGMLDLCFALSSLYIVLANMFVMKVTTFWGLHTTCVEPMTLAVFCIGNLLHADFGEKVAWRLLWITWAVVLAATALCGCIVLYQPAAVDLHAELYKLILLPAFRSVLISMIVFSCSYTFERLFFRWLQSKHISLRATLFFALAASQLLDTVLYTSLMFYERGITAVIEQIFYSYILKLAAISLMYDLH